ncbi:MAG: penicillin-binding protein 2 [Actinomycetota bacterium]|nr:penicillin-binding protein 2 [Actinomycetota bacterium]
MPDDRRPPMNPQLALRVAIVGSVALALFAIVFFRLWFLQVLSGEQYVHAATVNRMRDVKIHAQRGNILDHAGHLLVDSRQALAVQISPTELPPSSAGRNALYRRLAAVLQFSTRSRRCKVLTSTSVTPGGQIVQTFAYPRLAHIPCLVAQGLAVVSYRDVILKTDVATQVQFYLAERQDQFPGVSVGKVYVRAYPQAGLAAQLFGVVGPINSTEVKEKAYQGIPQDAIIGQSGLEANYDQFLRGRDGRETVSVDAAGRPVGTPTATAPVAGHDLRLSLDEGLQRVGQAALQQSITSNYPSTGGSFVAMNPQDGSIYAMGSLPTYDPKIFTGYLSQAAYDMLRSPAAHQPLLNRAIAGAGPTGSTFKPITAAAALESGAWTVGQTYDDTGSFPLQPGVNIFNAGHAVNGLLDLRSAIRVSSDTFFYNLGAHTNVANPLATPQGGPLQLWARRFGIGQRTGIDVPGESTGTLPSPAYRASRNRLEAQCDTATGPYTGKPKHSPGGCLIADGYNRPWSIGDNVNLAVGQGDVQATPLQLAVAYAALANGGTIVRPHVGESIQNQDGTVLQSISPRAPSHIAINPLYLETIRQGLRDAASQPGGTSAAVFAKFPEPVYGKTGTAQQNGQADTSWYACFVPASVTTKPIVVIVHVEQGGFGAVAAAPVAREILNQWFFGKPGPYVAGTSQTR